MEKQLIEKACEALDTKAVKVLDVVKVHGGQCAILFLTTDGRAVAIYWTGWMDEYIAYIWNADSKVKPSRCWVSEEYIFPGGWNSFRDLH